MATLEPAGPNAEQIKYWNETAGPKWIAFQRLLDAQLEPLGRRTMDAAGSVGGERVLDVGCGCGDTTLELGRRVGPEGRVLGVDVSGGMVARAAEAAREARLRNVGFENADAQTHRFARGEFDVLYSRFGVMFFADAAAAFTNLRSALGPGGRLAFICWQALRENPWLAVPLAAAARHLTLPPPPAPDAPGPFSLGDPERVRGILSRGSIRSSTNNLGSPRNRAAGRTPYLHGVECRKAARAAGSPLLLFPQCVAIVAKEGEIVTLIIGSFASGNGGVAGRRAASFCFFSALCRHRTPRGARPRIPAGTASARLADPNGSSGRSGAFEGCHRPARGRGGHERDRVVDFARIPAQGTIHDDGSSAPRGRPASCRRSARPPRR